MISTVTLLVSTVGFISSAIYICLIFYKGEEGQRIEHEMREYIKNVTNDYLLSDYETTNREIERREHITLLIGTIFIAASFLIFGESIVREVSNPMAASASIGLYFLWLFVLHLSTKRLDDMAYARIRAIEERLSQLGKYPFGIHTFFRTREQWWIWIRRGFWGWTYMLLSLCWMVFSLV